MVRWHLNVFAGKAVIWSVERIEDKMQQAFCAVSEAWVVYIYSTIAHVNIFRFVVQWNSAENMQLVFMYVSMIGVWALRLFGWGNSYVGRVGG
jgi:hypothetical protein